jgi:hypothetical protein
MAEVKSNRSAGTPIFTSVGGDAAPLFFEHYADLAIRNNKGKTVMKAAKAKGAFRQGVLRKANEKLNQP